MGKTVMAVLVVVALGPTLAGCGDDVPLADGINVIHEWESPNEIGGTVDYKLATGTDDMSAKELTQRELSVLEEDGWERKSYPGDPPSVLNLDSEDDEYGVRFGPVEPMSEVAMDARDRNELAEASHDPRRSIVIQIVGNDDY